MKQLECESVSTTGSSVLEKKPIEMPRELKHSQKRN